MHYVCVSYNVAAIIINLQIADELIDVILLGYLHAVIPNNSSDVVIPNRIYAGDDVIKIYNANVIVSKLTKTYFLCKLVHL
jgi:hypothetical protein